MFFCNPTGIMGYASSRGITKPGEPVLDLVCCEKCGAFYPNQIVHKCRPPLLVTGMVNHGD